MQYFDKNGKEIKAGMKILMDDGSIEMVYDTDSKLWIMLIQKNITKPQFRSLANLSPATFTKLNKNQTVSMEVMVRICQALQCNIGDVMDIELNNRPKGSTHASWGIDKES